MEFFHPVLNGNAFYGLYIKHVDGSNDIYFASSKYMEMYLDSLHVPVAEKKGNAYYGMDNMWNHFMFFPVTDTGSLHLMVTGNKKHDTEKAVIPFGMLSSIETVCILDEDDKRYFTLVIGSYCIEQANDDIEDIYIKLNDDDLNDIANACMNGDDVYINYSPVDLK